LEKLTQREEECAFLITKGLSNTQISERMVISRRRVENLINSLYQKFHILGDPGDPARRVILVESIRLLLSPRVADSEVSLLIIEDQEAQRMKLSNALKGNPRFKVLATAGDGTTGLQAALRTRPDVILVDIHLPDMDGFQVTREILESLPRTRAILMSNEESELYRERAIESGGIAFLPKKLLSPEIILRACDLFEG
jgi:DNA-binding NarL/FixJ family response regulator